MATGWKEQSKGGDQSISGAPVKVSTQKSVTFLSRRLIFPFHSHPPNTGEHRGLGTVAVSYLTHRRIRTTNIKDMSGLLGTPKAESPRAVKDVLIIGFGAVGAICRFISPYRTLYIPDHRYPQLYKRHLILHPIYESPSFSVVFPEPHT